MAILTLSGCLAVIDRRPVALPTAGWLQAINDPQFSFLIAREMPPPVGHRDPQASEAPRIAQEFIDFRTQQTALVLLARREDQDEQQATLARRSCAGAAYCLPRVLAQAQLAATHRAQGRRRANIAALRARLVRLTGSAPGAFDSLPGGPIPLPPVSHSANDSARMIDEATPRHARQALHRYARARLAAADAQTRAEHAQAFAATEAIGARANTINPASAIDADRQALDALQAEEHARAAMTRAYVELAKALGL